MKECIDFVLRKSKSPLDIEEIISRVESLMRKKDSSFRGLSSENLKEIKDIIVSGVSDCEYYKTPNERICPLYKTSFRKGNFFVKRKNKGEEYKVYSVSEVMSKDGNRFYEKDIYSIDNSLIGGAIDGDLVLIEIIQENDGNRFKSKEIYGKRARVVKILSRKIESIVGEVYSIGSQFFVKPFDKGKQGVLFSIDGSAVEGQIVSVFLKNQLSDNYFVGDIIRVYNFKDDPDEDILLEAFKHGVPDGISKESSIELENLPDRVTANDKVNRKNYTNLRTFTIDGDDTKDFDDALSTYDENGKRIVFVHIADVGRYVPYGSALFKDAYAMGNSYYLGGRVIPMLPHELSSGICSLMPGVERLTITCKMVFDDNGDIVDYNIYPSFIKSDIRMTYNNVNKVLNGEEYPIEYNEYVDDLRKLNELALVLRERRLSNGALEFNKPELKIVYDENGKAIDFKVRVEEAAENLIEEFMIAANTTVSKHLSSLDLPCIYRVHDKPNRERLDGFLNCVERLNIPLESYDVDDYIDSPKELQMLVSEISDYGPLSFVLNSKLVRCMSRAKYNPENTGHFGLSEEDYLHFTSPIRRFADLVVNCFLHEFCFKNDLSRVDYFKRNLPRFADQASKMERISDDLERIINSMKCCEYMENHIGEEYEGTVTDFSDKCILVQLDDLMIEGRVFFKHGDYKYDKEDFVLKSLDGNDDYYIGDGVRIKVVGASKNDRTIDFKVLEKIDYIIGDNGKEKVLLYD